MAAKEEKLKEKAFLERFGQGKASKELVEKGIIRNYKITHKQGRY